MFMNLFTILGRLALGPGPIGALGLVRLARGTELEPMVPRGMIFFFHSWLEITLLHLVLSFSYLIKWFIKFFVGFILFFMLLSSYYGVWFVVVLLWRLVYRHLIMDFDLWLACYGIMFFFVLLRRFICVRGIEK